MARLLARLIGQPVRRARAGSQEGKDALSDDSALAIECKRYAEGTSLTARHLISELEEAKTRHPDLQLWILATTKALGATEKEKLDQAAHSKGLAVLYLDTAATGPYLGSTHAIAALCATAIETTLEFLSGGVRRKVRTELETIRSTPGFVAWEEWLREEVRNRLPVWRFVIERSNLALRKRILETAYTAFGTHYAAEQAVRRQARTQLDEWLRRALTVQSPDIPPVAVVIGERYNGKTWLVYQWLVEIAERSPVPIFFVGSGRGMQSDRGLTELQIEDLSPALKRERTYAESFVHNYREQDAGKAPWALVVLDGLNEYALNYRAWLRHLEAALGRGEADCRPAAVLLTVRAHSWPELKDFLLRKQASTDIAVLSDREPHLTTIEIPLGPYTEEELQEALQRLRLPADLLGTISESARELAHRPRYLGLIAQHREQLGDYAAVTPEVLHWLDLCDKVGRTRPGREDWKPAQYQGLLRGLAKRWLDHRFLDEVSVQELLGNLTQQVPNVLADLRSEGALSGETGNYTVKPDHLVMGYGLFLRDSLVQAFRRGDALKEVLRDMLSPLVKGDEAVDALRAASTLMLVEVAAKGRTSSPSRESIEILDVLLDEWLNSRNLGRQDLEALHQLRKLLFDSLLRSWREIWSRKKCDSRMREIAVMVFGEEVESEGTSKAQLRTALQEWFRMVPLEGSWHQREQAKVELKAEGDSEAAAAEAVATLMRSRVGTPGLGCPALQLTESLDIQSLQAMGLYLVSRAPELVDPEDLLALMVVRALLEEPIDSGDFWVIRRALENIPLQWFEREALRCADEPSGTPGKALHELIRIADRADLSGMKERLSRNVGAEKRQAPFGPWPTKQNYRRLLRRSLKLAAEVERFAERARELLCDPSLPEPPQEQRLAFERALRKRLAEKMRAGELDTLQGFEDLIPAMAAWAPALGTQVIGRFLYDLPARIPKKKKNGKDKEQPPWLLELRGHATLASGRVRTALREALRLSRSRNKDWLVQRELTLALLPAATLEETVTLLEAKEEDYQHKETFSLAGALCTPSDRRALVDAIQTTRAPLRKRRLRLLLAEAGGAPLPINEVKAICRTLRKGEKWDVVAAVLLVAQAKLSGIDPQLLFPISRGEIATGTLAPDYASYLLVEQYEHEQIKGHLSDYWRAKSAARSPEDARAFLDEVSAQLAAYREARRGIPHHGVRRDLPEEISTYLDRERVAEWTRAFTSRDTITRPFLGGLIRPAFEWCLRNAATEEAKTLWSQVSPFERRRFGDRFRLTIDGVDWVLHELNRPEAHDDLARSFLRKLILDARTDLEILEISLGGLFRGGHRLRDLTRELAADPHAERRTKAVAILGWLSEENGLLRNLQETDPSLWVREQAEIALKRHELDSWARVWLERFLTAKSSTQRWAAGQMFLEGADGRIDSWAWKRIREAQLRRRLKGEAILLLWAAQERAKKGVDKLKSTLLGYRVNELSTVAHPWRRDDEWILDRYGRRR